MQNVLFFAYSYVVKAENKLNAEGVLLSNKSSSTYYNVCRAKCIGKHCFDLLF